MPVQKPYVEFQRRDSRHAKSLPTILAQAGDVNKFNFADKTYFCIRSLLLAHAVAAIQIYCVEQSDKINPQSMTTDAVEWFFHGARQMTHGRMNKR